MYTYTLYYNGKNLEIVADNVAQLTAKWKQIRTAKSHKMNVIARTTNN